MKAYRMPKTGLLWLLAAIMVVTAAGASTGLLIKQQVAATVKVDTGSAVRPEKPTASGLPAGTPFFGSVNEQGTVFSAAVGLAQRQRYFAQVPLRSLSNSTVVIEIELTSVVGGFVLHAGGSGNVHEVMRTGDKTWKVTVPPSARGAGSTPFDGVSFEIIGLGTPETDAYIEGTLHFIVGVGSSAVYVRPPFPLGLVANFTAAPTYGVKPLTVSFSDISDSLNGVTSWAWNFGDGTTSTVQNPTHTYTSPQSYSVSLTVTETGGSNGTVTKPSFITVVDISAPAVQTRSATSVAVSSALLNGDLTSKGTASNVSVSFEWGTTAGGPYPNTTTPQTMSSTGAFDAALTGLSPNTTYYFQTRADGGTSGLVYGAQMSFVTTAASAPVGLTAAASGITPGGATLNGSLTAMGTASTVNVSFRWGITSGGPYPFSSSPQAMTATGAFSAPVTGLSSGTTYYFTAKFDGGVSGVSYGSQLSFVSLSSPAVTTGVASSIAHNAATLNGNLTSLGSAAAVNVSFQWGTSPGGPYAYSTTPQSLAATGAFSAPVGGLLPSTTYYFKARADGGVSGIAYGSEASVTTLPPSPVVQTAATSGITHAAGTLNGSLESLGASTSVGVSFVWGITAGGPYPNSTSTQTVTAPGAFSASLTGLSPSTTYYYKAKADGGVNGIVYGSQFTFTTLPATPVVQTNAATSVANTTATLNGGLTGLGASSSVGISFVWGATAGGPYPNSTTTQTVTAAGAFSANLTGLTPGTAYYFKAKADGGVNGIVYGSQLSFTAPVAPAVTTGAATSVNNNSATLNGSLTALGTATTVNVSFQWGTTAGGPYPYSTTAQAMTTTGAFSATLTGLLPSTTYYFKARADGGANGISTGAQVSFTSSLLFYLHNYPTPPTGDTSAQVALPMNGSAPTATVLYNYDANKDTYPGRLIKTGGSGAGETSLDQMQNWRSQAFASSRAISGNVQFTVWTGTQYFTLNKPGSVTAYLREWNGSTYTEIANTTVTDSDWQGGSVGWVQTVFTFAGVNDTIASGRSLEIKLIANGGGSYQHMWFAYDTTSYAATLNLP